MTNTMNAVATFSSAIFAGIAVMISYFGYIDSSKAVANANRIAEGAAKEVARFNQKTILQNLVLDAKKGSMEFDDKLFAVSGHLVLVIDEGQVDKILNYGQTLIFDQVDDIKLNIAQLNQKLENLNLAKEKAIALDTKKLEKTTLNSKLIEVGGQLNIAKSEQNKIEQQIIKKENQVNSKLKTIKAILSDAPETDKEKTAKEKQINLLKKQIEEDNSYITEHRASLGVAELKTKKYRELVNNTKEENLRVEAELRNVKHEFRLILEEREHML